MIEAYGKRNTPRSSQPSMFEIMNWNKTGVNISESKD